MRAAHERRPKGRFQILALALLLATSSVQADDAKQTALARQLFEDGVAAMDAEEFERAEDAFRRVLALKDTPAVRYNLASALVKLGQLVEAFELLTKVRGDTNAQAGLRKVASKLARNVKPRIGRLTVHLIGDEREVELQIGGQPLPIEALDVAAPVDPGEHLIRALRDGVEVASTRVVVGEGKSKEVTLALPRTEPEPTAKAESQPAPAPSPATPSDLKLDAITEPAESGSVFESPWLWTGVGATLVAGVVTALILSSGGQPRGIEGSAGLIKVGE